MKLKIVGSGGVYQIPNPFCSCPVCEEAREKRGRYRRLGPSLYVEDVGLLIDTPEDIGVALERQGIHRVNYLTLSHKDPDHTRGIRMVEPLGFDAITDRGRPIDFIALSEVINDVNAWNGNTLEYYEKTLNCITIHAVDRFTLGPLELQLVNNKTHRGNMTFYVLTGEGKKVVYACCDAKPFQPDERYNGADVLILGLVSDDGVLKGGARLEDAPFRDDLFTLEEVLELKRHYGIGRVVVTHIDEYWGKSYGYYRELEQRLPGISFAYDGMELTV